VKTHPFRQHDAVPPHITSPLYRQLLTEWVALNETSSNRAAVRRWGRLEPVLAGHTRSGDIVDAIDAATPDRKDELLLALIRLFHNGHNLPGRVVLQAMLPKLARITQRTCPTSSDNAWTEDRHHITIAEFWDVLASYPLDRRPSRVASNLALDTLHRITRDHRPTEIPVDPTELPTHPQTLDQNATTGLLTKDADLTRTIAWALNEDVLTGPEATLLATIYGTTTGARGSYGFETAATHLGITPAAVRQRCSRTIRKLTTAVRADLDDTDQALLTA